MCICHLAHLTQAISSTQAGYKHPSLLQATLEEVKEADLLLHVLDASSPAVEQQRLAVLDVLRYLGFSQLDLKERVIEVWNKADLLQLPLHVQEAGDWAEPEAIAGFIEAAVDESAAGGKALLELSDSGGAAEDSQTYELAASKTSAATDAEAAKQVQQGVQDGLQLAASVDSTATLSLPQRAADGEHDGRHGNNASAERNAASWAGIDRMVQAVAEQHEPQALSTAEKAATQHGRKSPSDAASLPAAAPQYAASAAHHHAASDLEDDWDSSEDEAEAADGQQTVSMRSREEVEAWRARRLASRAACPNVATTSVKTGYGLQNLLMDVDRKVDHCLLQSPCSTVCSLFPGLSD